jgi:hypothetical protein
VAASVYPHSERTTPVPSRVQLPINRDIAASIPYVLCSQPSAWCRSNAMDTQHTYTVYASPTNAHDADDTVLTTMVHLLALRAIKRMERGARLGDGTQDERDMGQRYDTFQGIWSRCGGSEVRQVPGSTARRRRRGAGAGALTPHDGSEQAKGGNREGRVTRARTCPWRVRSHHPRHNGS